MGKFLSRREASDFMGISVKTLDSIVRERRIAFFRVGARVLFAPEDVSSYLAKARHEAGGVPAVRIAGAEPAQVA